ncbi:MAG: hypothetical protein PHN52_08935 [candidate division Zixibacteria bacterium]|nr:hypothetical protein [candidate division Zixibacteria bacterium]
MQTKRKTCLYVTVAVLLLLVPTVIVSARPTPTGKGVLDKKDSMLALSPSPATIDQITHNIGNIVTTVDNHGYIGGYWHYNLPSGEWPRNSGHYYIGELMYWMGATTSGGDTLVANTWDEFQGVPSVVSGASVNKILLSTDTARYYDYNPTDTVGLGNGNPAYGWRQWDSDSSAWVYSKNYDPNTSEFYPGGPVAVQESHYRFNDAAGGNSLMGLEMTHTMLQWNYCYNEDFIFVILEIKNTSTVDYHDFAFGLYVDLDVGGPDGTGENGRLMDKVAFDSTRNLAWTYDSLGWDRGWKAKTGIMGTKLLETPDNIGMTAFRTGDWSLVPSTDPPRYAMINSTQFDTSLPPTDQYYIQCTRGIDLTAGKTVRVVFAIIAGANTTEFLENADRAQQLYESNFIGPEPPITPRLWGKASDKKVYLYWNDTAQTSVDPRLMERDFAGYKLYRSVNQGRTWGEVDKENKNCCLKVDYIPLAYYPVIDPDDPVPHNFIDSNLYNGMEYWYCLVAFDKGDSAANVDVLQNGFGIAGVSPNVVALMPRNDPAGYYTAAATVTHTFTGTGQPSDGQVYPVIFEKDSVLGEQYQVVFEDQLVVTCWHLINLTTGDTLLKDQTDYEGDPGYMPLVEGIRVAVRNGDRVPRDYGQTAFTGSDTTLAMGYFYGEPIPPLTGDPGDVFNDGPYRSTYELRYTGQFTVAPLLIDYWVPSPTIDVPFEVWNMNTNQRVSLAVYDFEDDGDWDPYDLLSIVNYPYNASQDLTSLAFPFYYGWLFGFDDAVFNPSVGDVFTIEGAPVNGPDDVFTFRTDGVNASQAARDLKKIKVVPDPYYVSNDPRTETAEGMTVLEFRNVPDRCTIRIYTLAGDLVKTISNTDGDGTVRWDAISGDAQQVASGIYIYHIDSPYGERLGRFAIIK